MAEAQLIDGKVYAERLRAQVADDVAALKRDHGLQPGLAVVLVGDDPASQIYVRSKGEQSLAAGMHSVTHRLPDNTTQAELEALVANRIAGATPDGVLIVATHSVALLGQLDRLIVMERGRIVADGPTRSILVA